MAKIQNISEIHPTLGFTEFDIPEKYLKGFNDNELGKLYPVLPFERMIRLLERLLMQWGGIHKEHGASLRYTQNYRKRLSIIRKVLVQEKRMFEGRKVSDRIVSIDRYYVRSIVRGKETKSIEFGMKANSIQIDGISFIEHIPFKRHDMILQTESEEVIWLLLECHILSDRIFKKTQKNGNKNGI